MKFSTKVEHVEAVFIPKITDPKHPLSFFDNPELNTPAWLKTLIVENKLLPKYEYDKKEDSYYWIYSLNAGNKFNNGIAYVYVGPNYWIIRKENGSLEARRSAHFMNEFENDEVVNS